jgi:hypothetical protein
MAPFGPSAVKKIAPSGAASKMVASVSIAASTSIMAPSHKGAGHKTDASTLGMR